MVGAATWHFLFEVMGLGNPLPRRHGPSGAHSSVISTWRIARWSERPDAFVSVYSKGQQHSWLKVLRGRPAERLTSAAKFMDFRVLLKNVSDVCQACTQALIAALRADA
jgi:hypothetical protein